MEEKLDRIIELLERLPDPSRLNDKQILITLVDKSDMITTVDELAKRETINTIRYRP